MIEITGFSSFEVIKADVKLNIILGGLFCITERLIIPKRKVHYASKKARLFNKDFITPPKQMNTDLTRHARDRGRSGAVFEKFLEDFRIE
jgi:hypothetical protein